VHSPFLADPPDVVTQTSKLRDAAAKLLLGIKWQAHLLTQLVQSHAFSNAERQKGVKQLLLPSGQCLATYGV
jgi:hypothetical protein